MICGALGLSPLRRLRELAGSLGQQGLRVAAVEVYLPEAPALQCTDDFSRLPIHSVRDRMVLLRPDDLAQAAAAVAAAVQHLSS